jgi:uncharacterized protein (DUF1778 family)
MPRQVDEEDKKTEVIKVFCSPDEKERIKRAAMLDHRTDSNYLLNLFLRGERNEKNNQR